MQRQANWQAGTYCGCQSLHRHKHPPSCLINEPQQERKAGWPTVLSPAKEQIITAQQQSSWCCPQEQRQHDKEANLQNNPWCFWNEHLQAFSNARHLHGYNLTQLLAHLCLWNRLVAFALRDCLQDSSKDVHDEMRDNMNIQVGSIVLQDMFDFQRQILQGDVCHLQAFATVTPNLLRLVQ